MPAQVPFTRHSYIAVVGAGSWGTALAVLLARNGVPVRLWGNDVEHLRLLSARRQNPVHLPGIEFPEGLEISEDLAEMAAGTDAFLVVVPSHAFESVARELSAACADRSNLLVSWGTKGFDPAGDRLLSDVVAEHFGDRANGAVISGPSFAREVALGLPTALTVAAGRDDVADEVAQWLRNERVRVYTNDDLAGVQLGGAVKNVIALAAGISDGLGFGANARAALITRGLAELMRFGVAFGGRRETFMGLAGLGDLVLTCTDDQSRNRRVGLGLGRGESLTAVLARIGQEAEGVNTVRVLRRMAERVRVEMPITEQVYKVIYDALPASQAVDDLFQREPKAE